MIAEYLRNKKIINISALDWKCIWNSFTVFMPFSKARKKIKFSSQPTAALMKCHERQLEVFSNLYVRSGLNRWMIWAFYKQTNMFLSAWTSRKQRSSLLVQLYLNKHATLILSYCSAEITSYNTSFCNVVFIPAGLFWLYI